MSQAAAINFVLGEEGSALTDYPGDPGGLTRYGIALNRHPELTADDIRNMTPYAAAQIYSGPQYWGAIHADQLPDWLQLPMLDTCVNDGAMGAIKILQRALRLPGDGLWGPVTTQAVATAQRSLVTDFTAQRIMAYTEDSAWATDGLGWVIRAVKASMEAM